MSKKRMLFYFITARPDNSEQSELIKGISKQASEMDIDIAVVSNIYNTSEYNKFFSLENGIYDLIKSSEPDGIIVDTDVLLSDELRNNIVSMLDTVSDIPVVYIGTKISGVSGIDNDTATDIEKVTDHFIEVHGFDDIDILTGPDEEGVSRERVRGYKTSLEKHGIKFDKSKVVFGNFWINTGEELAQKYISGERRIPQGVVCTNDYMAYGLCDKLTEKGVKIPEDIMVIGYEYIHERLYHHPLITTYKRDREYLGAKSVIELYEKVSGKKYNSNISESGNMIYGNTCSCAEDSAVLLSEKKEMIENRGYMLCNENGELEQYLAEARSVMDMVWILRRYSYFIPPVQSLYMCLFDDWCMSVRDTNEHLMTCYPVIDIVCNIDNIYHFSYDELMPDELRNTENPSVFYFCPICFIEETFGYAILRVCENEPFKPAFRELLKVISNSLKFLKMKNDIEYLFTCQNLSVFHDSTTGLCNRAGFESEFMIAVKKSVSASFFLVCMFDINFSSKDITLEKDIMCKRLKVCMKVADELMGLSKDKNNFCGRLDDNRYVFAVSEIETEEKCRLTADKAFIKLFYTLLENQNINISFAVHSDKISSFDFDFCFEKLEKELENQAESAEDNYKKSGYEKYSELRWQIYKNPSLDINAEDASRKFCMSSGHFRSIYRKLFKISFHQDLINSRVSYAKYLLATTDISISAIADKCGYGDDKHFLHQFRLVTGYTPLKYRDKNI